jgi:aspartyl-tRNA(Asn)/glutamyl-tRNA(Gln) amidotransferase subunit A
MFASGLVWIETYAQHLTQFRERRAAYGEDLRAQLDLARQFDAPTVVQTQYARERVAHAVERVVSERADALLLPTVPVEAPPIGADTVQLGGESALVLFALASFTLLHNLTRLPTVAVPAGLGAGDLPTSVQITTAMGADALALNVAHQLEQALWPLAQRARDLDRVAAARRA